MTQEPITDEQFEGLFGAGPSGQDAIDPDEVDLELAEELVQKRYESTVRKLNEAWRAHDIETCQQLLKTLHGWRVALQRIQRVTADRRMLHIDSLVLADCYQSLFANSDIETIVYLTGIDIGETDTTVNRRISVDHDVQSAVKAVGDSEGSFDTLRELGRSGHRLVAHCHNHPGKGEHVPEPSEDDLTYQSQLEGGGYEVVGLIMNVEGYVRIFTDEIDIGIEIHGNHVERLNDERLFLEEPARNASIRIEEA